MLLLSPSAFLSQVRAEGVEIHADGDILRVRGPEDVCHNPEIVAYLKTYKGALLDLLHGSAMSVLESVASVEEVPGPSQEEANADDALFAQLIDAAERNLLPLSVPRLMLPSRRLADDMNVLIRGLAANLRHATLEHSNDIAIPVIPGEETEDGVEVSAVTWGQIVARDVADSRLLVKWWRENYT
jgi:hypothetical protein